MNEIINTTNPNKFWSSLKRMSTEQSNPQNTSIPVDKLYNHFENLHQKTQIMSYFDEQRNIAQNVNEQDLSKLSINELDKPITESEISNAIRLLKTKKAPGFDRVRNEMLKNGINSLMSSLVKLFNFIIQKRTFPKNWSIGMITPIFKSGNKSDPSNYTGICVTSCLGKLFCSILSN